MAETVATGDVRKMQKKDSKATEIEIPDTIYDLNTNTAYKKGRFFGKVRPTHNWFISLLEHIDHDLTMSVRDFYTISFYVYNR